MTEENAPEQWMKILQEIREDIQCDATDDYDSPEIAIDRIGKLADELVRIIDELVRIIAAHAPSQQGPAQPERGFDEATEKRWQDAIYELLKRSGGEHKQEPNAIVGDPDGVTDSGDALDFTLTEIGQALAYWQDRALTEESALPEGEVQPQPTKGPEKRK